MRLVRLASVALLALALAGCGGDDDNGGGSGPTAEGANPDTPPTVEQLKQVVEEHPLAEDCRQITIKAPHAVTNPSEHEASGVNCDDGPVIQVSKFPTEADRAKFEEGGLFSTSVPYFIADTTNVKFDPSALPGPYEELDDKIKGFSDAAKRLVELCDCGQAVKAKAAEGFYCC